MMMMTMTSPASLHVMVVVDINSAQDSVSCVKKLARFMDLDLSDELYSDIAEACSFENMKKQADQKATIEFSKKHSPEELKAKMMMSKPVIYRKG